MALVTTAVQSAFEELLFRGYVFQALLAGTNALVATVVISILFSTAHLANPHANWVSGLTLAGFSVLFCIAFIKTGALWFPAGLHFGWNFWFTTT